MKEKLGKLIKRVTLALLYIGVFLGAQAFLGIVSAYLMDGDYISAVNNTGWIFIFSAVIALGVYIVSFYMRDVSIKDRISIKKISFSEVVFAFTLSIGCRILTGVYMLWAEDVEALNDAIESAQSSFDVATMTGLEILALMISVYFAAPVIEEILFRGIVIKELSECMPPFLAIILQGVFFSIAHFNLAQLLFTVVIGIILGVVYHKTKNLVITMLVHMFFNCSSILTISNKDTALQTALIGLLLTGVSLFMIIYVNNRRKLLKNIGGTYNG